MRHFISLALALSIAVTSVSPADAQWQPLVIVINHPLTRAAGLWLFSTILCPAANACTTQVKLGTKETVEISVKQAFDHLQRRLPALSSPEEKLEVFTYLASAAYYVKDRSMAAHYRANAAAELKNIDPAALTPERALRILTAVKALHSVNTDFEGIELAQAITESAPAKSSPLKAQVSITTDDGSTCYGPVVYLNPETKIVQLYDRQNDRMLTFTYDPASPSLKPEFQAVGYNWNVVASEAGRITKVVCTGKQDAEVIQIDQTLRKMWSSLSMAAQNNTDAGAFKAAFSGKACPKIPDDALINDPGLLKNKTPENYAEQTFRIVSIDPGAMVAVLDLSQIYTGSGYAMYELREINPNGGRWWVTRTKYIKAPLII